MRRFEDEVFGLVDKFFFGASIISPKNKHFMFGIFGDIFYDCIGELLPAYFGMGVSLMSSDCEG